MPASGRKRVGNLSSIDKAATVSLLQTEEEIRKHEETVDDLQLNQMLNILKIPSVESEASKFSLALRWVRGHENARSVHLPELLKMIDLARVHEQDMNLLKKEFEKRELRQNVACLQMYTRFLEKKLESSSQAHVRSSTLPSPSSTLDSPRNVNDGKVPNGTTPKQASQETSIELISIPISRSGAKPTPPKNGNRRGGKPSPKSSTACDESEGEEGKAGLSTTRKRHRGKTLKSNAGGESDEEEPRERTRQKRNASKDSRPDDERSDLPSSPKRVVRSATEASSTSSDCLIYPCKQGKLRFIYSYNWEKKTSEKLYKMEIPRDYACGVSAGNDYYLIGGTESKYSPNFGDETEGSTVVEIFGISGKRFRRRGPAILEPRKEFSGCAVGDYIYVTGGCYKNHALNHCEKLNWTTDGAEWQTMEHFLKKPRGAHATSVIQSKIFTVGGIGTQTVADVEVFDIEAAKPWKSVAPMLMPRGRLSTVAINDELYAIGGEDQDEEVLNSVERYNATTNEWKNIASMQCRRREAGVTVRYGAICVIGGNEPSVPASMEFFDPRIGKWSKSPIPPALLENGDFSCAAEMTCP